MNVIEMLETMALLSVGPDNLTSQTKSIFLKFLNIANRKLYNKTASVNPDILINEDIETDEDNETVKLSNIPYLVSSVYIKDRYPGLNLKSFSDFVDVKKYINNSGEPQFFTFRKDLVSIYPIRPNTKYELDIWYSKQPDKITEKTVESEIPYPISFHDLLVDEALYYLFLDEEGFKDSRKSMEAKDRAIKQEKELISYLYSNSNQNLRTFSNI